MPKKKFKQHRASRSQSQHQVNKAQSSLVNIVTSDEDHQKLELTAASQNNLPAVSSRVMFWRSKYLADSPWLEHIPFYFWLVEELRPRLVVEPNLNSAVGYFAICQAIDKLSMDSVAHAAFGQNCDVEYVRQYNHQNYREFSRLSDESGNELLESLADNSIDLLMLKHDSHLLRCEDVMNSWQTKLAENAVILIHGSRVKAISQICKSLKKQYQHFELEHGQGLMLVYTGTELPKRLAAMIEQSEDHSAQRLIQEVYGRLGCAHQDAWHRQVSDKKAFELNTNLQVGQQTIQNMQEDKRSLEQNLTQANQDGFDKKEQMKQQQLDIEQRFDELATLTRMLTEADRVVDEQKLEKQLQSELSAKQLEHTQEKLQQAESMLASRLKQSELSAKQLEQTQIKLQQAESKLASKLKQSELPAKQLEQTQTKLQQTESELASRLKQSELSAKQLEQTQTKLQQTESELASRLKQITEREKANIQLAAELKQTQDLNRMLERDQQVAAEIISKLKQSELTQQQSLDQRFDELGILTRMLVDQEAGFTQQLAAIETEISKLKQSELTQQQSLDQRFDELGILTKKLVDQEAGFTQQLAAIETEKGALIGRLKQFKVQIAAVEAEKVALGETFDQFKLLNQKVEKSESESRLKSKMKSVKQRRITAKQFKKDALLIQQSALFDETWYIEQYPKAGGHKQGAAWHYLESGLSEQTNPSQLFDGKWYLQTHQDVQKAQMNPLFHYEKFGKKEERTIKAIEK
jgi:myosin heavy subunit